MGYRCRWQGIGRAYEEPESQIIESQHNIYNLFDIKKSEEHKVKYDVFVEDSIVAHIAHLMAYDYVWLNGWRKDDHIYSSRSECSKDPFLFNCIITIYGLQNNDTVVGKKYCSCCEHKIINDEFTAIDIEKFIHSDCVDEWKGLLKNG